ncbi:FmdB family zinc ribbon protein [Mycobacteroides chelonae]|uniref:FmdB family zinc ribbon protein n=1 Tax=Mycobacteroides chelonae TaxID=1774 RepID=UPI0008A970D8|nr:FmdB family zinc ribbon protein [Mycobacteroides chelonae]PKQ56336.1 FmdB family transcriptional regulator [Mycobacterium sp. MHSD3]AYM41096.1 FmdB family transcriptional regulator [[Mycobacterium] chelonae subsp. gwanakae]MBF9520298.1 FmdB family transcriptional regulator [Mycobacteroides chelonae]MBV0917689.1 FmdB family transcriptional regulator [Mycobacteroides chelonae]OHT80489.1 FmdB family transcriptional regulator [Mycobacteroides chelonae]
MPTYSYACADCGDKFDIVQAFTDDALTVCQKCSGKLRKLFNSVGIVFKGSGFYRTDSRSGSVDAASKGDSGSKSESKSSESSASSSSTSSTSSSSSSTSTATASAAAS